MSVSIKLWAATERGIGIGIKQSRGGHRVGGVERGGGVQRMDRFLGAARCIGSAADSIFSSPWWARLWQSSAPMDLIPRLRLGL